ncbi:hypothetical protein [Klebsiella pneumoniae]|uniref:hypothetical protein n=1 Tax=Klebsiella pneumoniae TaxID=573 RepID=UPI001C590E9A|nr:hypothetical protein [Klebsiella pneumoniae]MBW3341306.1 hypothetical protein [Klebsiella pneumoniae]HBT3893469.1 hypothetical protein [Klebsiella pneumoniae]
MDFRLTKMQVLNLNFTEEKQGDPDSDSRLQIDAVMEISEQNPFVARMVIDTVLSAPGRYEMIAKLAFIFKFQKETPPEQIEKSLVEADTESLLYPYINTYLTNFIMGAGYPRPGIPLILK